MNKRELNLKRKKIDQADRQLRALLVKRLALSTQVIKQKRASKRPKRDAARERQILQSVSRGLSPRQSRFVKSVMKEILKQTLILNR